MFHLQMKERADVVTAKFAKRIPRKPGRSRAYRIVLPVRNRIHCGIGRFDFCFLARIFFTRKVLLHGMLRAHRRKPVAHQQDNSGVRAASSGALFAWSVLGAANTAGALGPPHEAGVPRAGQRAAGGVRMPKGQLAACCKARFHQSSAPTPPTAQDACAEDCQVVPTGGSLPVRARHTAMGRAGKGHGTAWG